MRRPAALIAALVCAFTMILTGSALAGDDEHDKGGKDGKDCSFGKAFGDAVAGPGVPFFAPTFDLCKTGPGDADVTGYFMASVVPSGGLIAPQGPITCAAFRDDTVSFLYPLNEKSSPPPTGSTGSAILIVAKDGGASGDTVGFFGPAPIAAFGGNNCSFSTLPTTVADNITQLPVLTGGVTVQPPKQ